MNNPASLRSEVTRLDWINCPVCRGIADQFAVERVSSLSGIRNYEFINVYCGGVGGSGKIANLKKSNNPFLAQLVQADNDVLLTVNAVRENFYDCEITDRQQRRRKSLPNTPVSYDAIDKDIHRCFIAYKSGLTGSIGSHEQMIAVEEAIAKICASNGGRFYKSKAKGAKFAVIFSLYQHTPETIYMLQKTGYKVTTFSRALEHFNLTHMWNFDEYNEQKKFVKKYVEIME